MHAQLSPQNLDLSQLAVEIYLLHVPVKMPEEMNESNIPDFPTYPFPTT